MSVKFNHLSKSLFKYDEFNLLDGFHPYQNLGSDYFVLYEVVQLNKGNVLYFNFNLAKEIGLVPNYHPEKMNPRLHKKIIDTFSIQIINEYDQLTKKRFSKEAIKPKKYMATRYLQLQHKNKKGKTSGDGRSIWNGQIKTSLTTWDISSRGTGVTCLSPGAAQSNKPLQTGNDQIGYGCGQAELDELISCALMSEVVHNMGIYTERTLAVIDLGNGVGIGVRAAQSLLRPAHGFLFLKQNKLPQLTGFFNFHLGNLGLPINSKSYDVFLNNYVLKMASFAAKLEEHYLFVWLDWDGDNVLLEPGIIDYGSVRHFGSCHDQYRYDDVDRFSTNLMEQKKKAQLLVQSMIQAIDYVKSGKKKPFSDYKTHPLIDTFKKHFKRIKFQTLCAKMGFSNNQTKKILNSPKNRAVFFKFYKSYYFWETLKFQNKMTDVADGINKEPLANLRGFLRDFPTFMLNNKYYTLDDFITSTWVQGAPKKSLQLYKKNFREFNNLISNYQKLWKNLKINTAAKQAEVANRSLRWNPENFMSGNGLIHIVDSILKYYKSTNDLTLVQESTEKIINFISNPELNQRPKFEIKLIDKKESSKLNSNLWNEIVMHLHDHKDEF